MKMTGTAIKLALAVLLCIPVSTSAMEFSWGAGWAGVDAIKMSGEIKVGDGEKFRIFMRSNFQRFKAFRNVGLESDGGSLPDALLMAQILKAVYANVTVTGERHACASSCFFLYLASVRRVFDATSLLGIHRAFFDPVYFAG